MPNAIVNGISIDYKVTGDGPPVLLICATGQPADLWFAQVADLTAAGHTVITFDNRGCGRSEAPPAPYLVADMAADTAALIEHLGLGPCDIIGYSLGGYIAQELAVTRAGLVRRLVFLTEAAPPWTNPGRLGQYQADLAWLEDSSQLDRLSQIKSPCLAMAFEHDCWFPPRSVREAVRRIPGCRYAELPGQGHGAPLLAADQVNPALAEFLG